MIKLKSKPASTVDDVLKKSVITEGFEKLPHVPLNNKNQRLAKKERRQEKLKTKGESWFNLPVMKITPEVHKDLEVLQMRSALDPRRFYKRNDMKMLPKYFQVGRVQDSATDAHKATRKERKKNIVEELLADMEAKQYIKRKHQEIMYSDPKRRRKAQLKAKRLKKQKR
ncbi:hypothetical protein V9T40_001296 [Parthenolecanium corni]|uniref:Fcf2 pre-rRNA processing C-terminal domain-containing protein n=1 Tax=Parthenolecanium corni TaxID=536013 RepID=A0AAN9TB61_9HEMI